MDLTIYLLHFDTPLHHAGHYIGCTKDLENRLLLHSKGQSSSRLMSAIHKLGIGFRLARAWSAPQGFTTESQLKKTYRNGARLCPICHPENQRGKFIGKEKKVEHDLL